MPDMNPLFLDMSMWQSGRQKVLMRETKDYFLTEFCLLFAMHLVHQIQVYSALLELKLGDTEYWKLTSCS